jgi:feruloyl esterase
MIENKNLLNASLLLLMPLSSYAADCDVSIFEQLATDSPNGVTLSSADVIDKMGGYCQVEGSIANAEDGESQIKFRIRLPGEAAWNGKFLVVGNGGTAGSFQGENRVNAVLQLGYATGQTDTGHTSIRGEAENWVMKESDSGTMLPNNVAMDDFSHRAIHLTTVIGKQFVDEFYEQAPEYSYYFGCSTGGRQGLRAMQSYPNDFDGIIAGAPVYSLTRLNMSQLWKGQQIQSLNDKGETLSDDQLASIKEAVLSNCDAVDGLADRIIDDPRQCDFDPAALSCESTSSATACLTDTQVDFVRTIYQGPITQAGERIYPGAIPGGESGGRQGGWQAFLKSNCTNEAGSGRCDYLARAWFQDPVMDLLNNFSIDDPEQVAAADSSYFSTVSRADNSDVTPFVQSGGKAIVYHGWADINVTPYPTVEIYDAMESTVSRKRGIDDFRDHVRLFMAPGMGHCQGGDGPNNYTQSVLAAIDKWVVEGTAPDSILATHEQRGISRPWCPYPQVARLKAADLDSNNAENFHCVAPPE